jgi:hypothetical protein
MSTIREHEWAELRRLYVQGCKQLMKEVKESHETGAKPVGRVFLRHPIYKFWVAVEFSCEWATEVPMLLGEAVKELEGGQ